MSRIRISFALACVLSLSGCVSTEVYPLFSAESRTSISRDYDAGFRYQHGIGVPQNYELATAAYKRAEAAGDVRAINNLGVMALRGQLGGLGKVRAANYFKKAAAAGSSNGYYNLGLVKEVGSLKADYKGALRDYETAAKMGHAAAQFRLAQMYQSGIGVPSSPGQAKAYFDLAAMAGNTEAIARMHSIQGRVLSHSDIVNLVASDNCECETASEKVMSGRGLESLQQMAAKGDAPARYNLGVRYMKGDGAPKDASEAVRFFTLAAHQGYAPAQRQLAQMHLRGEGVAPSKLLGHTWLNLASRSQGADGAAARAELQKLELSMTSAEIRQAQSMAAAGAFAGR